MLGGRKKGEWWMTCFMRYVGGKEGGKREVLGAGKVGEGMSRDGWLN